MGLMDQVQADIKRIVTDLDGWGLPMVFSYVDGSKTASVTGIFTKIHFAQDLEGNFVNSERAKVTVHESSLNELGYVTRNAKNNCTIKDHLVTVTEKTTNKSTKYRIDQVFPDETVGLLVCMLGETK